MKLYPRLRPWLLGFMCLLMCGCNPCDPDNEEVVTPGPYAFTITNACEATDGSGAVIARLDLVAGQTVTYCNNWTAKAEVKFTRAGFLPGGATAVTLNAGDCITHTVDSFPDGEWAWAVTCEGDPTPGSGGPVKVDNPPPGP